MEVDKSLIKPTRDLSTCDRGARLKGNEVGGVIGCKVSNFSNCCVAASLLQEEPSFLYMISALDIAAVDDEGRAHCIAGQLLGALKEGNSINRR